MISATELAGLKDFAEQQMTLVATSIKRPTYTQGATGGRILVVPTPTVASNVLCEKAALVEDAKGAAYKSIDSLYMDKITTVLRFPVSTDVRIEDEIILAINPTVTYKVVNVTASDVTKKVYCLSLR